MATDRAAMHSALEMMLNSTTSVSRFDAYWLPACCPASLFTDEFYGQKRRPRGCRPPPSLQHVRRPVRHLVRAGRGDQRERHDHVRASR